MEDYPVLSKYAQCIHKGPDKWKRKAEERIRAVAAREEFGSTLLALKTEEWEHRPENAGGLWRLEKTKKQILPQEGCMQLCRYPEFSPVSPISDF